MMLPIVGTIRNTVKIAEMDGKWQQRKNNIGKEPMTDMDYQIKMFKEDIRRMKENEKLGAIDSKLKAGMGLTPDEIEYLQKKYPEKYKEYLEIAKEKEAYERQLKTCKTKEDVERLKFNKMNGYLAEAKSVTNNPNIPKSKKLELLEKLLKKVMGVQSVHMEFVKSVRYKNLPTDEERTEEIKDRNESADEKVESEKAQAENEDKQVESEKEQSENTDGKVENEKAQTEKAQPDSMGEKISGEGMQEGSTDIKLPELTVKADNEYKEVRQMLSDYLGISFRYNQKSEKATVKKV